MILNDVDVFLKNELILLIREYKDSDEKHYKKRKEILNMVIVIESYLKQNNIS